MMVEKKRESEALMPGEKKLGGAHLHFPEKEEAKTPWKAEYFPLKDKVKWEKRINEIIKGFRGAPTAREEVLEVIGEYTRRLREAKTKEEELEAGHDFYDSLEEIKKKFKSGREEFDEFMEPLLSHLEERKEEMREGEAEVPPSREPPRPPEPPITPESIDLKRIKKYIKKPEEAKTILRRIFVEDPRSLFTGEGGERSVVTLKIEGRIYDQKEDIIRACEAVLREAGEADFLEDFQVWRKMAEIKWTVHQRIKPAKEGDSLVADIGLMREQGLMPSEKEWSRMVAYFMEWGRSPHREAPERWFEHFNVYNDPEFITQDYKRQSGESDEEFRRRRDYYWKHVYLYSLERRGIKLSEEALKEVRDLVFAKEDDWEKRAKLKAIEVMREICCIPCRVGKTDRYGKKIYDVYPTGGISEEVIKRQIEGFEFPEDRQTATHLFNRIRRVVGFEDAVTAFLHYGVDYYEWLYKWVRYALETRILAMTRNGVSANGSDDPLRMGRLERPNDIKVLDTTRASNLTLYAIAKMSGRSVGEEKPAETGNFFNHLGSRDRYSEEYLRTRGIAETVIPYLSWIPGRDEIVDLYSELATILHYLLPNSIYAPDRSPEGINLINFLCDRVGYAVYSTRKIMEACGVAEFSWRGRAFGSILLEPDDIARIFLNYLYQRKMEKAADGTKLEVPDKELVDALLNSPVLFEKVEVSYLDEDGREVEGVLDERDFVFNLIRLKAQGYRWEWTVEDMTDTDEGKIGSSLSPLERAYLEKDPNEHPIRLRDKIWGLALYRLTMDERFEVMFKLATQKRKGELLYGIREISPTGEPIFRWITIVPELIKAKVERNRRQKAVLEKLGEVNVRQLATEIGDEEVMKRLGQSLEIIGVEKVRKLARAMASGRELEYSDPLYQELTLSPQEIEELVQRLERREEAREEIRRLEEEEGGEIPQSVIQDLEFDRRDFLRRLGKLDRETFDQLKDVLRIPRLRAQILRVAEKGYQPSEITKEHIIFSESSLSEEEKDEVINALRTPEIRALVLSRGLDGFTEDFGLSDDEKTYFYGRLETGDERIMVLEKREFVDEREVLRKWRKNMREGREATAGFTPAERRYFNQYENRVRLKAINELEKERAKREINRIRLKIENAVRAEERRDFWFHEVIMGGRTDFDFLSEKERGLLQRWVDHHALEGSREEIMRIRLKLEKAGIDWNEEVVNKGKADFNQLSREEKDLLQKWVEDLGGVYFDVEQDAEQFTSLQETSYRLLADPERGLFGYYNWRIVRNIFGLDYPWLDLQRRHFLSHVYGWALERKIGALSDEALENLEGNSKLEEELHPKKKKEPFYLRFPVTRWFMEPIAPSTRRNPDAIIDFLNKLLQEKLAMHFRYNLKIERNGVLVPAPVVPMGTEESSGDLGLLKEGIPIGDLLAFFEVGDKTYSEVAFMGHERFDEPLTLALRDRLFQVARRRLHTCPRFLKARLGALTLRHIMRLAPNEWDLFKTRDMKPRLPLLFGKVVTKNEEGFYATLENAGILSGPIAECLKRIEGLGYSNPEAYRSREARWGIMDEVEKKIGIELFVEQMKSAFKEIPLLGRVLEKIPTVSVPAISFEIPLVTGGAGFLGEAVRVMFFATRGGFNPFGTVPMISYGLSIAGFLVPIIFKEKVIEKFTREGRLYDCVLDPRELAQSVIEDISKLTGGRQR